MASHSTRKSGAQGRAQTVGRRTTRNVKRGAVRVNTAGRTR